MDEKKASGETRHPRWFRRPLLLHPVRLISDLLAEHTRPWKLGVAAAFGALIGTLPLYGLHTVIVYVAARQLRLNRIMALGTNQLGLPPLVPALCIEVGYYLRHREYLTEISVRTLGHEAPLRLWEWVLGAFVVGPALAVVCGVAVWLLAILVQWRFPPDGGGTPQPAPAGTARRTDLTGS